jgi:hypothetical protein
MSEEHIELLIAEMLSGNEEAPEIVANTILADEGDDDPNDERLDELIDMLQSVRVDTFRDAGVLANNHGLVVTVGDAEFQLTIVRSR